MSPLKVLRVGLASSLDVSRYKRATYHISGYTEFLGELVLAFPGQVFLDDVIGVRTFKYSGHVYDLQSVVGYFNSNNIISRNCRCVAIAVSEPTDEGDVE